ncbi:MAG: LamG-like jellyroll fold domain-containing protein [Candidatus Zixiibacteriota bacterium]
MMRVNTSVAPSLLGEPSIRQFAQQAVRYPVGRRSEFRMWRNEKPDNCTGFTFVEIVLVVLIIGVLASVAMKSASQLSVSAKVEQTKQEMTALARAITGNEQLQNNGIRTDFGYVGDIGALPPNLNALMTSPGYATWNGPYVSNEVLQIADDFSRDAWGVAYGYSTDSLYILSSGSGEAIFRRLGESTDALLRNRLTGNIFDMDGTPPGTTYKDSIVVALTMPDGLGGTVIKTTTPTAGGYFSIDSIPIGVHQITVIYLPESDSLTRELAVESGSSAYTEFNLQKNYWYGSFSGVIGWWPFDETSGTTASDASDNGRNGTLTNMSAPSCWVTGHADSALLFDGSNDYVQVAYESAFDLSTAYTLTGWFRMASADKADYRTILCKQTNSTSRNWWLCLRADGSLYWRLSSGGISYTVTSVGDYADNAWHSFAAVKQGSSMKLYADGNLIGSAVGAPNADTQAQPVIIGSENGANCFKGRLDDIRIYSKGLNASEISAMAM